MKDLIRVATLSPRIADIILNHYIIGKFRFHEQKIICSIEALVVDPMVARIQIAHGLDEIRLALELFGHTIQQLHYEAHEFGSSKWQELFKAFDEFCPHATKDITIYAMDGSALAANWSYSFDETTAQVSIPYIKNNTIPLDIVFPFMKYLTISRLGESDARHHPHLTHLLFNGDYTDDKNARLSEFIHLNPQLQHFETSFINNMTYMRYLSESLPNLESLRIRLEVTSCEIPSEIIHFKNVKEFTFDLFSAIQSYDKFGRNVPAQLILDAYHRAISNITFDQLHTLKVEANRIVPSAHLIQMIAQNKALQKLQTNFQMTSAEMLGLIEVLPGLKEFSFELNTREMVSTLAALLLNSHGLNMIKVYRSCDGVDAETFAEIIPSAWEFARNETLTNYFTFTRKN